MAGLAKKNVRSGSSAGGPKATAANAASYGTVTVKKVGGSFQVTVPAKARDALHLAEGETLGVDVVDGRLMLSPTRPKLTFAERLAMCDPDTPRSVELQEWMDAPPVGRELW
jgi:antitoxin ChpS